MLLSPDNQCAATLEASLRLLMNRGVLATAVARGGKLACTNAKFDDTFGMAPGTAIGKPIAEICAEGDRARVIQAIEAAASGAIEPAEPGDPGCVTVSFDAVRSDGSVLEVDLLLAPGVIEDRPATVLLLTDSTERRRVERQLSYLAFLDPLTGLANRALFLDRLRETLTAARRDGRVFAVLMCDLDGFKKVNDSLGHDAGDELLKTVARRLEGAVRGTDTVARQGGDEFAVILARVACREDVALVASRMVRAFDEPIEVGGSPCAVGISVGIATFPADGGDMDALIGRADGAMYESKRAGKHRFTFAEDQEGCAAPVHHDFFQWSDAHAVGVMAIDAQHRRILTLLNKLADDLKAGRGRDAILGSLRALVSFTVKHFATEERLMESAPGWPMEDAHAREHKKLIDDLASLTVNVEVKSMMLTLRFLQEWLLRHIEGMDKPMSVWLRDHGVR